MQGCEFNPWSHVPQGQNPNHETEAIVTNPVKTLKKKKERKQDCCFKQREKNQNSLLVFDIN